MNAINWTPKAIKQLRKLDKPVQRELYGAVSDLANMPDCRNIKSLVNHTYGYRLRVGNYRILFDWDNKIRVIAIQEVKKRDERTY